MLKEVFIDNQYEQFIPIQSGWTVVDIGASIGDFAIMSRKKNCKVYAFEMNEAYIDIFKSNMSVNNVSSIVIEHKEVTSLNEIFQKYNLKECDLVKIDCEGAEYEIIENTNPKDLKKIKRFIFEIHFFNTVMKKKYKDLCKKLQVNGFVLEEKFHPARRRLRFLYAHSV